MTSLRALSALLAIGLVAAGCGSLHAGLKWTTTTIEPEVTSSSVAAETIEAVFDFTVEGDAPVRILKTESDCGCTTARLEKDIYQPGEKGRVVALFSPGQRRGTHEKHVLVFASDKTSPHKLKLTVAIPELYNLSQRLLVWEKGAAMETKQVDIRIETGLSLKLQPVRAPHSEKIIAVLHQGHEPGAYFVSVTPLKGSAKALIPLSLQLLEGEKVVSPITLIARIN